MAAGAVLIVTINATVIGIIIFGERITNFILDMFDNIAMLKSSSILMNMTAVVLIAIILGYITGK